MLKRRRTRRIPRRRSSRRFGLRRGYNKYHAKRTTIDGITFASQAEARRYAYLKTAQRNGLIRGLTLQVKFDLRVGPTKIGTYIADFVYDVKSGTTWCHVVEDVKGFKTPLYRWKKKHMAAEYGIDIAEV